MHNTGTKKYNDLSFKPLDSSHLYIWTAHCCNCNSLWIKDIQINKWRMMNEYWIPGGWKHKWNVCSLQKCRFVALSHSSFAQSKQTLFYVGDSCRQSLWHCAQSALKIIVYHFLSQLSFVWLLFLMLMKDHKSIIFLQ